MDQKAKKEKRLFISIRVLLAILIVSVIIPYFNPLRFNLVGTPDEYKFRDPNQYNTQSAQMQEIYATINHFVFLDTFLASPIEDVYRDRYDENDELIYDDAYFDAIADESAYIHSNPEFIADLKEGAKPASGMYAAATVMFSIFFLLCLASLILCVFKGQLFKLGMIMTKATAIYGVVCTVFSTAAILMFNSALQKGDAAIKWPLLGSAISLSWSNFFCMVLSIAVAVVAFIAYPGFVRGFKRDKSKLSNADLFSHRFKVDMQHNWLLYLMVIPVILYYVLFHYMPIYGASIAFKDHYVPRYGVDAAPWANPLLKYFFDFLASDKFLQIFRNTLTISLLMLAFGFPAPIILALLLNELRSRKFSRLVQTVSYIPHFISMVVLCGMIWQFTRSEGIITYIAVNFFGMEKQAMLGNADFFRPIYVVSGIWAEVGWGSIIYLAALTSIDPTLYEAAKIDGAGRWRQTLSVTLPSIMPTIIILLILRTGTILNVGFEKIILLYGPETYDVADVISSYVYRFGIVETNYSYSAAVGLFNSIINFAMVMTVNQISKKTTEVSLW